MISRSRHRDRNKHTGMTFAFCLLMMLVACAGPARGGAPSAAPAEKGPGAPRSKAPLAPPAGPLTYIGSADCRDCHGQQHAKVLDSAHRVLFTRKNLKENKKGCEACHGQASAHIEDTDKVGLPVSFRHSTPAQINKACTTCHRQEALAAFKTAGHGRDGRTSCTSCHSIHQPGGDKLLGADEASTCFKCHQEKRAQMNMPSHHPIREGKMKCTGCHNPHGSATGAPGMLARENVNETCLKCHENLAGPWAFEHQPAAKSCIICHRPHGSVNYRLLAVPEPSLCVKCHNPEHAGFATRPAPNASNRSLQRQLAYQSCSHCHPRIHGSDNDHGFTN